MNFSETSREVFQVDEKTKLLTYIWMPKTKPRAILIGIHGGMAHAGDWVTPALFFMKKDIATYAPDLRWHGTYPQYNPGGKVYFHIDSYDQYANDVAKFVGWVKSRHPGIPIFIIAHSNGALIALYYGLTIGQDEDIKGFILSSPWLKNKVEVPPILLKLSKILVKIVPTLAIKPEPLIGKLTHDKDITARHYADEAAGLRGTHASVRLGVESMKTQEWVLNNIAFWKKFPVFAVVAGQDMLADPEVSESALKKIPAKLLTYHRYEENYHENFNELNREKIFIQISQWINKILSEKTDQTTSSKKGTTHKSKQSKRKR
ncbi:MAG: lysophospholipase [Spirochaetes bacterium]|nr:lysophospholipase [Spirochaetota bacterium]